jgi:hypothetical protein
MTKLQPVTLQKTINYIILPVLNMHGIWCAIFKKEHRPRVLENRVTRNLFWSKREKIATDWGKLHNEELCDMYSSPNITNVIESRRI